MSRFSRPLLYPSCLVLGSLLAAVAAALHPMLAGDGATQLATIARSSAWRAIHWAFLFGFPLTLAGLFGLVAEHAGTPGERAVRAGMTVGTFAYATWSVIVAFMAGAGSALAQRFVASDPGGAAAAVFLFEMVHPFGLAMQRAAGFALGVATVLFGWAAITGKVLPRGLGVGGMVAGIVGMVLALIFPENTKADQAAFVLPVVWQIATGVVLLRGRAGPD